MKINQLPSLARDGLEFEEKNKTREMKPKRKKNLNKKKATEKCMCAD